MANLTFGASTDGDSNRHITDAIIIASLVQAVSAMTHSSKSLDYCRPHVRPGDHEGDRRDMTKASFVVSVLLNVAIDYGQGSLSPPLQPI